MAVVISWTKTPKWSSSDDGTVLGGADLGNLQTDIEGHSHSGIATLLSELNDISLASVAQGNILYRGATYWNNLAVGTAGYILKSGGAGANPSWLQTLPTANGGTNSTADANAASGVVVLDANSKISVAQLGAWVDKSASYGAQQAATDGFVLADGVAISGNFGLYGYSDANADPTTVRALSRNNYNPNICMPVKKNDYWKVVLDGVTITRVFWIPLGS